MSELFYEPYLVEILKKAAFQQIQGFMEPVSRINVTEIMAMLIILSVHSVFLK